MQDTRRTKTLSQQATRVWLLLIAFGLAGSASASGEKPMSFVGPPTNRAECAAYVAEGNRLMGLVAESLIAKANAEKQAAAMPASPAPTAPRANGSVTPPKSPAATGSAAAGATPEDPTATLVDQGSRLFHLGLACEGVRPAANGKPTAKN